MTQEAGTPRDFWGRIQKMIDDSVAKLARSGMLRNASISGGSLVIKEGGTLRVLYPKELGSGLGVFFGDLYSASSPSDYVGTGTLMQAPTGYDIATFRSDAAAGTLAIIRDGQEHAVFYTDSVTGQGLGRPWFSTPFYLARNNDWPVVTSTTFETVYRAKMVKHHSRMLVRTWGTNNTAGATGEIRVMINGVQLSSTATTSSALVSGAVYYGTVDHAEWAEDLTIEVQARLASGTGGVQVSPSECTSRN